MEQQETQSREKNFRYEFVEETVGSAQERKRMNTAPENFDPSKDLPKGFYDWYLTLHKKYTPWQQDLIRKRREVLNKALKGEAYPDYLPKSEAVTGNWKIDLPDFVKDQRNQMTGPSDDGELVVKMLNSGAPGVMIDLEDSMANRWDVLMRGVDNSIAALYGELTYEKDGKTVGIKQSKTVPMVRVRGLHLSQAGVVPDNDITSASLFDTALVAYLVDRDKLKVPLTFYIPKSESAEEAQWWNELFKDIAKHKGWEPNYIKAMALVEAFPMSYQIEEFIFNLRDHILALNLGRWDYMASYIHFNFNDPDYILPDRNTIPHDVEFFQSIRLRIPQVCHKRGILAIGGMTALYPSRVDAELNDRALKVLAQDKKNEANCGMDGAWTGHPDQNEIAIAQFPEPNQLNFIDKSLPDQPDLRPSPKGVGKTTVEGTRTAIWTTIHYRFGYLNGRGASLINGYMEDLATDRIYRLMVAQRFAHSDKAEIVDENGNTFEHTPELLSKLYDEQLQKILDALPDDADRHTVETYKEARRQSEEMIVKGWFDPV